MPLCNDLDMKFLNVNHKVVGTFKMIYSDEIWLLSFAESALLLGWSGVSFLCDGRCSAVKEAILSAKSHGDPQLLGHG